MVRRSNISGRKHFTKNVKTNLPLQITPEEQDQLRQSSMCWLHEPLHLNESMSWSTLNQRYPPQLEVDRTNETVRKDKIENEYYQLCYT